VIVREKPTAWELFFVSRGSVILRILPQMIAVTGLTLLLVVLHRRGWAQISDHRAAGLVCNRRYPLHLRCLSQLGKL